MTTLATSLSNAMTGRAVAHGDSDWNAASQAFNTLLDQRPDAVVLPENERDVVAAVRFARERGLRVAPQATAHNAGPLGDQRGSLLVQVSKLGEVSIDPAARRVRVGAGVKWERVGPRLSELGLAGLHGSSPDVGIAGYSLGGGMGWLARSHGLQTNSVTAFELVTADGHLVRTDAVHEPDLFWALRGGGGNFGVVTAIEFAVYPLKELYAGAMFFPMEQASDVLHAWRELLPSLPEQLMTWANLFRFPDDPGVPEPLRGGSYAIVMAAFQGDEADGRELLRPVRELGPAIDTLAMGPPAILAELAMDPPDPLPFVLGHQLLEVPSAAAIDDLVEVAGHESGAALTMVQLRHMGGALAREAPGAGARATLPGDVCFVGLGVVHDQQPAAAVEASLEAVEGALLPHRAGFYPNFVEEPADASAFFDTRTWARLREVKALYDPDDLFRGNHHVPPAAREEVAA
jgi:FAD/FMN-containing dehydrogenase